MPAESKINAAGNSVAKAAGAFATEDRAVVFIMAIFSLTAIALAYAPKNIDFMGAYVGIMASPMSWFGIGWVILKGLIWASPFIQQGIDAWDRATCINCKPKKEIK
jgi:hypothetical protein